MTLFDVIKAIYVPGDTLAQVTEKLTTKTIHTINDKPSGFSDLYDLLGKDNVILLRSKLKQAIQNTSLPEVVRAKLDMAFTNLDQGDFNFYENLNELESLRTPLASIGINVDLLKSWASKMINLLEQNKLTPTNSELDETYTQVKINQVKSDLLISGANTYNAWVDAVSAWNGTGSAPMLGG